LDREQARSQPEGPRARFRRRTAGFQGDTFTFEDDRFRYDEQRFVTLGLLAGIPVSIVHTESDHDIRIISFRKATRREAQIYFGQVRD
jgi:uncharacterized DUF497 family protein